MENNSLYSITDVDGTVYIAGAVAVGAFLLVTLLITSAITVAVLRMRKRRKELVPVEGTEGPEVIGISLTPTTNKQQENIEASGEREELHRRSADALGQSCPRMMTAVRSEGDYYDIIDVPSQEGNGPQCNHTKDHRDDQAKGDPSAVYAVVDKSKKKKQEKTRGGASATTTQGADTEEQHYEWSSGLGQDCFGNVLEVSHGDRGQGGLSNDSWETCPQSEPCTASAVYAVVDKSKKHKGEKTQGGASATTTQGADTEEQHYEWSSGLGQDWLGNVVEPEVNYGGIEQASSSNEAKQTDPQSESGNSSALYAVVDKSKKRKQEKTQDGASGNTTQGTDTEEQHYECSNVVGQDWFETAGEVNPEATLTNAGCSSTDTETNDPQSEPYNVNPNALYAVVDKSKKRRKVSANDAPSLTSAHVDASESQKHNTGQGPHV